MLRTAFAILVLAALFATGEARVSVNRAPIDEYEARVQSSNKECTAIYTVTVEPRYTVQGNDLGMLPTHGRDTTVTRDNPDYLNFNAWTDGGSQNRQFGGNYVGEPYRTDPSRQARAEALLSVTALTEVDATPLGFQRDTLRQYHAICVYVRGVQDRWVEVMAETLQPDQQVCVEDWGRQDLAENILQSSCGNGNLYTCRESANTINTEGVYEDRMGLKFFCRDSCDDPDFEFFWRVTASQEKPLLIQNEDGSSFWQNPDGENWCAHREGDDFPSSLLQPYPKNYEQPAIFERSVAAGSVASSSTLGLIASLALFAVFGALWANN